MWKGDQVSASISAASVLAKCARDRHMTALHEDYPDYGFDVHKATQITRRTVPRSARTAVRDPSTSIHHRSPSHEREPHER